MRPVITRTNVWKRITNKNKKLCLKTTTTILRNISQQRILTALFKWKSNRIRIRIRVRVRARVRARDSDRGRGRERDREREE